MLVRRLWTLTLMAGLLGAPGLASACGGFFCGGTPIDQTGERVLFGVKDGQVTAHIQISYAGEAEEFAWVLPLPHAPSHIGVGTDVLFQQLEQRTRPQFQLQWVNNNECYYYGGGFGFDDADGLNPSPGGAAENESGVNVLEQKAVGPYDIAVIEAKDKGNAAAVYEWLKNNDYDQPPESKDLISTYVAEGHKFVAIKLQSDQGVGDIQPIVLEFPFPGSCIPLRLTSIAAQDDMDVWVYMLGQHRAIPVNYFHVEVNEKKIDWINWGSNYKEVARDAVDQAAGRAFLTEYAGDTNDMKGVLWQPGLYDTKKLESITAPWDFVNAMLSQNFPRNAQMQAIIRKHIPKPESLKDLTDQQFYNQLSSYQNELKDLDFDPVAMVKDIEEKVFEPMADANKLFAQFRYMTRMFTVISPFEMTRDPIFLFNPDLPNVDRMHRATGKATCEPGNPNMPKMVTVTLEDGSEMKYDIPEQWAQPVLQGGAEDLDAASAVERMYTSGDPDTIDKKDIAAVDKQFDSITLGLVVEPPAQPKTDSTTAQASPSAGCTAGNGGGWGGILAVLFMTFGFLFVVRRRRAGMAALVAAAALTAAAPGAEACGGFFCNNTPIVQKGERVLFGVDKGHVTTHIQIFYEGEAEKFAWVLPIPAEPTVVGLSSDTLFTNLENRTAPRFDVQWINDNQCYFYGWGYYGEYDDRATGGAPNAESDGDKGVEVLQTHSIGAYEIAVIKGTSKDSFAEVWQWLDDNGYDQPDMAQDILKTYVAEEHLFVAVKLQSDKSTGDIQPLTLQYPFVGGCVPLRLTSIAATDDMDVWVYMLGQHRAVPVNYFHVEVNEKKIDWIRGGSNYKELAAKAVNTAAGRGFLTEYAGDTNDMRGVLWKPGVYNMDKLASKTTPWEFVNEMLMQNLPRTALMQQVIRTHVPKPASLADVADQAFYNNLEGYKEQLKDQPFDSEAFVADIEARVFAPLMEANSMFDQFRYMTRMYTVLSPNEMTRDPIFLYNPDLPNVSNIHRAVGHATCKPGNNQDVQSVTVTLENGEEIVYDGPFDFNDAPKWLDESVLGADGTVSRMYTSGAPEEVKASDVAAVDQQFDSITVGLLVDDPPKTPSTPNTHSSDASSPSAGCTVSNRSAGSGLALVFFSAIGLLGLWRRRNA